MDRWKPINYRGSISYDPRDELRLRLQVARDNNDDWVAIPVKLAVACAEIRECKATTVVDGDEDGPFFKPVTITCRRPENHVAQGFSKHYNGSTIWEDNDART